MTNNLTPEQAERRYELLCKDIKHQMEYIDDYYTIDFQFLQDTLDEMKELQIVLRKND